MSMPSHRQWEQVSPLLDELLDLEPQARRARLAELRAEEEALAAELEVLLDAAAEMGASSFLEHGVPDVRDGAAAAPTLVGEQVGAYLIEALLGEGATGSVWRARRADGRFEAAVAIKLLHMSRIGRAGALRFEREGAILARLQHPNIARLLDAGITAVGQPFMVLELVEGEHLDRYCDAQRLNVRQRLALFEHVLRAIEHAHSQLVIHRDIKPNNILVTADGNVKLLDFGIAKLLQGDASRPTITVTGHPVLTPQYAAPEQVLGAAVSTATDVYALGVLLYVLLTGRHPTASDQANSAEVLHAALDTVPTRLAKTFGQHAASDGPSLQRRADCRGTSPARLRRQLEGDLENIVARALRKAPAERYQTVSALAEDLRRHRDHELVSARPDSWAYRCTKFARRYRGAVIAASLVMVSIVAGLVGTTTQAQRAQAERDNALRQLGYATASSEFIGYLLEAGADKPFTTPALLARGEVLVARQFSDQPALRARLQLVLGGLYAQANQTNKAMALMQQARSTARETKDSLLQADIECQLAGQHSNAGSFEPARAMLDAAIAGQQDAPAGERGTLAACLVERSTHGNWTGDPVAALADAQAALAALGAPRADQRMLQIQARAALADSQGNLGRSADAVRGYERAIADLDAMGRGRTQMAATLHNNLGRLLSIGGQPLRAARAYERALALGRDFDGAGAEATLAGNYAKVLIELGRHREALPLIEHALNEAHANGNDKVLAPSIALLGAPAWCATSDLVRCAELLGMARAGLTATLAPGRSRLGTLEIAQAHLSIARQDWPRARQDLDRAVAIFAAAADRNPFGIRALTMLARTEQRLGDLDAAQAHATAAVTQARQAMSGFEHSEWLGSALVAQGLVQRARGDENAARESWRAARAELSATVGASAPAYLELRTLSGDALVGR
jgi:eukaryotic-like serine/threonine-protein kinase